MAAKFYYGGQAVIEGVMMRGRKAIVTAVRRPNGEVSTDTRPLEGIYTGWMRKTPLLRGVIVLIENLQPIVNGPDRTNNIMADLAGDEGREF